MTTSLVRIGALVVKEYQDFKSNSQILLMAALPIFFVLLYKNMTDEIEIRAVFPLLMALTMVTSYTQSLLIAEEKEKNTLRVLLLSPAKNIEILVGKSALTFLLTIIVCFICLLITSSATTNGVLLWGLISLASLFFIIIGTIIGLFSQTVTQTSIIGLPIILFFFLGPTFEPLIENTYLLTFIQLLPSSHFNTGVIAILTGGTFIDVSKHFLNIFLWTIGSFVLCMWLFKKRQFDS